MRQVPGIEVAIATDATGQGILGTIPDLRGQPLATAVIGPREVQVTTTTGASAGACACSGDNCCDICEPCSGEKPCCITGGGGGGGMEPFLAE